MKGSPPLLDAVLNRRILVVCGAGGVGKTTTAAALALRGALLGRRVLVCTIDPSRRLVTSLGLTRLSERPKVLNISSFAPAPGGALSALVLDTKRIFDRVVARHAPSDEARRRILENRFYREVSAALSGSHEYMAMEKLLDLSADSRYDLVVLDTPPTRHALDFLEAPERLLGFLDTSVLRYVLKPYFVAGRLTLKVATRTGALALRLADRVLGLQFLQDLSEFFLAFEGMYDGFKERAAKVHLLLRDVGSGFVMVASPSSSALDEARYFRRRLREQGMPFVGFVVNRIHPDPVQNPSPVGRAKVSIDRDLADQLMRVHRDERQVARRERRLVAALARETHEHIVLVPEQDGDVHDLKGLKMVGAALVSRTGTMRRRVPTR